MMNPAKATKKFVYNSVVANMASSNVGIHAPTSIVKKPTNASNAFKVPVEQHTSLKLLHDGLPDSLALDKDVRPAKKIRLSASLSQNTSSLPSASVGVGSGQILPEIDMENDIDSLMLSKEATEEIDQIEIAASQAIAVKSNKTKAHVMLAHSKTSKMIVPEFFSACNDDAFGADDFVYDSPIRGEIQNKPFGNSLPVNTSKETLSLKLPEKSDPSQIEAKKISLCVPSKAVSRPILATTALSDCPISTDTGPSNLGDCSVVLGKANENIVSDLETEISKLRKKLLDVQETYYTKDGEIKILRESLKKASEDESKLRELAHCMQKQLDSQQSDKVKLLEMEIEKLKTQLTFKEREVQEALDKYGKKFVPSSSPNLDISQSYSKFGDGFVRTKKSKIEKSCTCDCRQSISKPVCSHINNNTAGTMQARSPITGGIHGQYTCTLFLQRLSVNLSPQSMIHQISSRFSKLSFEIENLACAHANSVNTSCSADVPYGLMYKLAPLLNSALDDGISAAALVKMLARNVLNIPDCVAVGTHRKNSGDDNCSVTNFVSGSSALCELCNCAFICGLQSVIALNVACESSATVKKVLLDSLHEALCMDSDSEKQEPSSITQNSKVEVDGRAYFQRDGPFSSILSERPPSSGFGHRLSTEAVLPVRDLLVFAGSAAADQKYPMVLKVEFFSLFARMSSECGADDCERLVSFIQKYQLLRFFHDSVDEDHLMLIAELAKNLGNSKNLPSLLCTSSDRCVFLKLYAYLVSRCQSRTTKYQQLQSEVMKLLSSLLAENRSTAFQVLLDGPCLCCGEVIKCLVVTLYEDFKFLRENLFLMEEQNWTEESRRRLMVFRQGISLLGSLCMNTRALVEKRAEAEWQFLNLLCGTIRLFRAIPFISESEVTILHDILGDEIEDELSDVMEVDT